MLAWVEPRRKLYPTGHHSNCCSAAHAGHHTANVSSRIWLARAGIIDSIRLSLLQEDTQLGQDVTEDVDSVRVRKEGCEEREEEPEKKKKRTFFLRTSCFFFGLRSPVTIFPVQIR